MHILYDNELNVDNLVIFCEQLMKHILPVLTRT